MPASNAGTLPSSGRRSLQSPRPSINHTWSTSMTASAFAARDPSGAGSPVDSTSVSNAVDSVSGSTSTPGGRRLPPPALTLQIPAPLMALWLSELPDSPCFSSGGARSFSSQWSAESCAIFSSDSGSPQEPITPSGFLENYVPDTPTDSQCSSTASRIARVRRVPGRYAASRVSSCAIYSSDAGSLRYAVLPDLDIVNDIYWRGNETPALLSELDPPADGELSPVGSISSSIDSIAVYSSNSFFPRSPLLPPSRITDATPLITDNFPISPVSHSPSSGSQDNFFQRPISRRLLSGSYDDLLDRPISPRNRFFQRLGSNTPSFIYQPHGPLSPNPFLHPLPSPFSSITHTAATWETLSSAYPATNTQATTPLAQAIAHYPTPHPSPVPLPSIPSSSTYISTTFSPRFQTGNELVLYTELRKEIEAAQTEVRDLLSEAHGRITALHEVCASRIDGGIRGFDPLLDALGDVESGLSGVHACREWKLLMAGCSSAQQDLRGLLAIEACLPGWVSRWRVFAFMVAKVERMWNDPASNGVGMRIVACGAGPRVEITGEGRGLLAVVLERGWREFGVGVGVEVEAERKEEEEQEVKKPALPLVKRKKKGAVLKLFGAIKRWSQT